MLKWNCYILFLLSFIKLGAQHSVEYSGKVGLNMFVKMNLTYLNQKVIGDYSYAGQSGSLKLNGSLGKSNEFSLNEFNPKGSISGEFYGKKLDAYLVGVWRKPDGRTSFTFLATETSLGSPESALMDDSVKLYYTLYEWSEAHNTQNISKFESLFANEVLFYANKLDRITVLRKKNNMFRKYTFFHQYILPGIYMTEYENGVIKCDFVKRVIYDDKATDYPGYLLLKGEGDRFVVIGESDRISDQNMGFKLDIGERVYRHWYTSRIFIIICIVIFVIAASVYYRKKIRLIKPTEVIGFFSFNKGHKLNK